MTIKLSSDKMIQVAELLSQGTMLDGPSIGQKLGISRTAVWKIINRLKAYGIAFENTKGYQMKEPLILLDQNQLEAISNQCSIDASIHVLESIDSTRDVVKKMGHLAVCLAETQTAGKGRMNRSWHSPFGQNIYLSIQYQINRDISELSGLSLDLGLAVYDVLKTYDFDDNLAVKWPNDIIYNYQKLAGILLEVSAESHGGCALTVSVGLNVNMLETRDIDQPFTSMRLILNKIFDRNEVAAKLIKSLIETLKKVESLGIVDLPTRWQKADGYKGKKINIDNGHFIETGTVVGVNQFGQLLLEDAIGAVKSYSSGDTSILKR